MRTLYVRIIVMTTAIMLISSIVGFIVTNIYYDHVLKEQNDAKVVSIANNAVDIFEQSKEEDIGNYLTTLSTLGYQFYLIDENGDGRLFGEPFRKYEMNQVMVDKVLQGGTYHGIKDYPWKLFITGFFDNELVNTVGIPIQVNGKTEALFVRQNTKLQFGEMRIFLAILLVLILVLSFILIILSTMFVVRPIKRLTEATKKIASGNFHLKLNVNRSDEIGRLAQDFTKMSEQLAKTEEKRQEFVSNVSHEIQSPLTSIQGFSKVLREEEISEDMRHHYSDIIYKESQRLSALSKQLLTLSFLDRGEGQEDCLYLMLLNS
ncbi:histidine kinase dimerization/phospho-acceptor domain-containing protein [Paracerasibacillus soli]|uniref:histidine kinase n=1 Tax=Paracerasibacillus soli TaxID=480284 RepID=A0ABU5CV53_9BACI|nr:histidine kinase dimerization/phospho-acceptor domain-containing protein [Virgibacillus soli]MDY0410253.1 HAMP domain-containing protein [Virgibacillus soli]